MSKVPFEERNLDSSVASADTVAGATDCENSEQSTLTEKPKKKVTKRIATAYITKIAVLSALSIVLYMFAKFPIFSVFPFSVLDMHFADIPALLGGFAMGPVAAFIITLIRCTVKLATSTTMYVGEISNFIVSLALVMPSAIIYKYKKNIKGALIGLIVGILLNAVVSIICNYFITVPFYASILAASGSGELIMSVRTEFACIYGLSFNVIKGVVASALTFILYKRLSKILHL